MDWKTFWTQVEEFFVTLAKNLALLLVIFVAGIVIIKVLLSLLKTAMNKTKMDSTPKRFILSVVRVSLYILLVYIIANSIGIPTTGFLAVISAGGLAISLALQGSLSNLANGIVIISTKPFKDGDYVKILDIEGTVKEIKMLSTILTTPDNKLVSIPNKNIVENTLINYSQNKYRKIILKLNFDNIEKIDEIKLLIDNILNSSQFVEKVPKFSVDIVNISSQSYTIEIKCNTLNKNYVKCKNNLIENITKSLQKNSISLASEKIKIIS